jgi:hypothetical protein
MRFMLIYFNVLGSFDSEEFDIQAINKSLGRIESNRLLVCLTQS